jgi:predicted lipid-binding transport protein (Tim44 family)
MPAMRTLARSLLALLLVTACDSGEKKPKAESPEDLDAKKAAAAAEDAKNVEERRKEREAKAAAEAKAAEDLKAQIDALCVVPEGAKKPKKLGDACEAVVTAQSSFIQRAFAHDPAKLEKLKGASQMQNQMTTQMCLAGNIDVAVCQKHALDSAPKELGKDLNDIMRVCVEKYGAAPKGPAVLPKRKPG